MWDIISSTGVGDHTRCTEAFLFSMVNPSGPVLTKMPLNPGMEDFAIYCLHDNGPTFGQGSDLYIQDNANEVLSGCTPSNTYKFPPGEQGKFFTGRKTFLVTNYEVFGLLGPWQQSVQATLHDRWLIHHGCCMKLWTLCRDGRLQK